MRSTTKLGLGVALLIVGAGCGSRPIPLVAVPGTTIVIPVPHTFGAGFGRALNGVVATNPYTELTGPLAVAYTPGSALEDEQRGELLFELHDDTGSFAGYLPIRYMTRLHVDEASQGASPSPSEPGGGGGGDGETVALVDVPANVPAGSYTIEVERWLRDEANVGQFVQGPQPVLNDPPGPWVGWGWEDANGNDDPQKGIPFEVADVSTSYGNAFNPFKAWTNFLGNYVEGGNVKASLNKSIPRPKVYLYVVTPSGQPLPASWELEVQYPRERIEVLGVELRRPHRSSGVAAWQRDPGALVDCSSPGMATIKIMMIDLTQKTDLMSVAFRPRNFGDTCGGRAQASDFVITPGSLKAYDASGAPITTASAQFLDGTIQ